MTVGRVWLRAGNLSGLGLAAGYSNRRWWAAALVLGVVGVTTLACSSATSAAPPPASTEQPLTPKAAVTATANLKVVATTTLLADLARNVGGDLISVTTLVPPGADAHAFQSTPSVGIAVDQADVIISNGLGLDNFIEPVIESTRRHTAVRIVAAEGLDPPMLLGYEEHQASGGNLRTEIGQQRRHPGDRDGANPHLWLDPILTIHYVERIRQGLVEADPANDSTYRSNAEVYIGRLRDLDRELAQTLSRVPPERRRLVTYHDAFSYLVRRYGWQASALVPDDASDPTPGTIIAVAKQIKESGISAVFTEPQFSSGVLRQAAIDAGLRVGVLHSLPNNDLPTYVEMMRFNAESMVENLK